MANRILTSAALASVLLAGGIHTILAQETGKNDRVSGIGPTHGETGDDADPTAEFQHFRTASIFIDTFRATHIARGTIVDVVNVNGFPALVFKPMEMLKGVAPAQETMTLITGTNADLSSLKGQAAVAGIIETVDGEYGLAHGVQSLTPESLNVEASVKLLKDVLDLNARYSVAIQTALNENPRSGKFRFPAKLVEGWTNILLDNLLRESRSQAAHHSGRELLVNPVFKGVLTEEQLHRIGQEVGEFSASGTYDRGYIYLILAQYHSDAASIDTTLNLMRGETALNNVDHMAHYLRSAFDEKSVIEKLSKVYGNREESALARRNAIAMAGSFGSTEALPTLRVLLGHETDRSAKRELLNAFRDLPHEGNFQPLLNYLNGGDATSEKGVQTDCVDSRNLLKRTLLAMAVVDSKASNITIREAYLTASFPWLKDFIRPLLEENKQGRGLVKVLDNEDDVAIGAKPVKTPK